MWQNPLELLADKFSRDLENLCDAKQTIEKEFKFQDQSIIQKKISSNGVSYDLRASKGDDNNKYLIVFSDDRFNFNVRIHDDIMVESTEQDKIDKIGDNQAFQRNHKLTHESWRRNREISIRGKILLVSLLRFYSGNNGSFISCIFRRVPGLENLNIEVIYPCSQDSTDQILFGTELK